MAAITQFYSQYTALQIDDTITKSNTKPFVIVTDEESKCKRVFLTQEDANTWFAARTAGEMTQEIADLEFAGNTIPGDEQYELRVNITNPTAYALSGSTGNYVFFNFATVDKSSQAVTGESVDIYFAISNGDGTRQKPKVYTYEEGKTYKFLLDDYLATGVNTVTMTVRGRTSGLSKVLSMTYEILNFSLETSFDISKSLNIDDSLSVTYICKGDYQRTVHFYIDGTEAGSETISAIETSPTKVKTWPLFGQSHGVGTHTLQIKASMSLNETVFWSPLLFREFEVIGEDHTITLVSNDFPSTQDPFNGTLPGFSGQQYVKQSLVWAFYSSSVSTANVLWKLFDASGNETTIGSRQADVVEGETDVMPDPVTFMPTESGIFKLQAIVNGTVIKEYTITVDPNEELTEATDGITMRLTAIGRSNDEDTLYRSDWSCTKSGIHSYCEFSDGFPFTAAAGYNNEGVEFYNGYTGIIKGYKPMAPENASVTKNGLCFGMRFRTYNMDNEDALVAWIGDPDSGPGIFIYPNKAILRSSAGSARDVTVRFKDEEDTDIYWIIYPNANADMSMFTFLQVNGVRCFPRIYDIAENYNVGSTTDSSDLGYLHIGDPNGQCGIRVYSIRAYTIYQGERQLCNNFIIDGTEDLSAQVTKNDIYQQGGGLLDVDVTKLEERMPLIKFTGDLSSMQGSLGKPELEDVGFELTHPDYYDHYATCESAHLKKAGQSTQDRLGPPSMHVKFNKNKSNVLKDRNGKQWPKNRFPILPGYTPENSLRILNNTLDSSCCNSGGALTFINKIAQNTEIDGKYPLRTPALNYVLSGQYAEDMATAHGGSASDYTFPYKLSFTPVAYAGAAIWRKDSDSPWQWLGMYTFIEEKKSFYANGGHSIYDKIADDGTLDPFDILSGKKGNVLYDNEGYLRFEIVTKSKYSMLQKGGEDTFDTDISGREAAIEKISEHDDETEAQTTADWNEYGNEIVKPLCATEGNQTAFDKIIWNIFDIDSVCAYYIWMLIVCNTDGSFRNMNQTRYLTGAKWKLTPWDWDMTLGLLQDTYKLDAPVNSDLYTLVDGTYIFNGMGNRIAGATDLDSYWFWDACLNNAEFKARLPKVFAAMYSAGMNKQGWLDAFDSFTTSFCPALYNVDAQGKYIQPYYNYSKNYLVSDQGDRTAHRHWFLDSNVDYFEQMYGVGDFVNTRTSTRAADADNATIYLTAGAGAYFGWTISGQETGSSTEDVETSTRTSRMTIGQDFTMTVNRLLTSKDILGILSPQKLLKIDMHEFARYFSAELSFNACYNSTTKASLMKQLILGMTFDDIKSYGCNERAISTIDGVTLMARLEEFNIRGLKGLASNPIITGCTNLRKYYAAGSGITAFNPAEGSVFTEVELNDSLGSMMATDVTFPTDGPKFYTVGEDMDPTEVSCPTSLKVLQFSGMGSDPGTLVLLHNWLMMLKDNPTILSQAQLTCRNIYWTNATKADVLTLANITMLRNITGYVYCTDGTFTLDEMSTLITAFGSNVFDYDSKQLNLVCDCPGNGVIISASGDTVNINDDGSVEVEQGHAVTFTGAGFPISGSSKDNYRWRVIVDGSWGYGSDDIPVYTFGSNDELSLNYVTGELTTSECSTASTTYTIGVIDVKTRVTGTIVLKVNPRTYPNVVTTSLQTSQQSVLTYDGEYQITARGAYVFGATHTRLLEGETLTYTGTMKENGGVWELVGGDDSYVVRNLDNETDHNILYCLQVKAFDTEDISLTLKYKSNWKNDTVLNAEDIKIALVTIIETLLINDTDDSDGNIPLFKAVENYGAPHAAAAYYTSMEIKAVEDTFNAAELLGEEADTLTHLMSGIYFIPYYMKNVDNFNFSDCINLKGSVDITNMPWIVSFDLSNTSTVNINGIVNKNYLSSVKMHKPTQFEILTCPLININTISNDVFMSCDEIDLLAHDVCGTKLTLDDDTGEIKSRVGGIVTINPTDSYYSDAAQDLADKGITINTSDKIEYVRILDIEVMKVLNSKNIGSDGKITKAQAESVTSISTWFRNNTQIRYITDMLRCINCSSFESAFTGCTSLSGIVKIPENIKTINGGFQNCTSIDSIVFYGVTSAKGYQQAKVGMFFPTIVSMGGVLLGLCTYQVADFGKKTSICGDNDYAVTHFGTTQNVIIRSSAVATNNLFGTGFQTLFVPQDLVSSYQEADGWSDSSTKIKAIGGEEWVEVFGSTDEYADITMYAPDDYDEIKAAYENA